MRKIIIVVVFTIVSIVSNAQVKLDDFGRIILNTYLPEDIELPTEAKKLLKTKLSQIASNNGMGGSDVNPRFIITANVNIGTKDIIAGPPQMIAQNIDVTLFVGDAVTNTIFSSNTLSVAGVGTNENKAFIDAFKRINPRNKEVLAFLEKGKEKIVNYYYTQCDFILKEANTLADQFKFNEAIFILMSVPEVCKECYFNSKELATSIFNRKADSDCIEKLKKANMIWSANPTAEGAMKVAAIVENIVPSEKCISNINKLSNEIKKKLKADEQKQFEYKILEMEKKYDTEQKRLDAQRQIAVEQAKNQPQTITYNNIYWR